MQRGAILLAFAAFASASDFAEIARKVNEANAGWVAQAPSRFATLEEAARLCGTWLRGHPAYVELPEATHFKRPRSALPDSFDARRQWPQCKTIQTVRDQSSCGSCWAFGSTETFEDRLCIHQRKNVSMSTEDTAACCKGTQCGFSNGCGGGQPGAALRWMTETGIVTGGLYDDKTTCQPYTLPPCAHHVPPSAKYPKCPEREYRTPACKSTCQASYGTSFEADKVKGKRSYAIRGVENIMSALLDGPVSAAFSVYSDFPTYKSGVYRHTHGSPLGGHAVEIVGYGTENGDDYWVVKNSWNEQWGDNGHFKILKGHNECGIEGEITAIDF